MGTVSLTFFLSKKVENFHFINLFNSLEESIINLFKNSGQLIDGQLKQTHEDITALLNSNFGIFVFDRLKVNK